MDGRLMILHCPRPGREIPSLSPFVLKLQTYIRMVKMNYQVRFPIELQRTISSLIGFGLILILSFLDGYEDSVRTNREDPLANPRRRREAL
jgi:hypothetical protein